MNETKTSFISQNDSVLNKLLSYYSKDDNLEKMLKIITGKSKISLSILDWFSTNYAKKYFTLITLDNGKRCKVYEDYKLKLKGYSKDRFDPFCRSERISIPYKNETCIETTIGQLNFFMWIFDNNIIEYIENNYEDIYNDMYERNSSRNSSRRKDKLAIEQSQNTKTRKKREELSISASKSIKKEIVEIVVSFT